MRGVLIGENAASLAFGVGVRAHHRLGADAGIGAGLYSGLNNRPGVCGPGTATRPGEATKMYLEYTCVASFLERT